MTIPIDVENTKYYWNDITGSLLLIVKIHSVPSQELVALNLLDIQMQQSLNKITTGCRTQCIAPYPAFQLITYLMLVISVLSKISAILTFK